LQLHESVTRTSDLLLSFDQLPDPDTIFPMVAKVFPHLLLLPTDRDKLSDIVPFVTAYFAPHLTKIPLGRLQKEVGGLDSLRNAVSHLYTILYDLYFNQVGKLVILSPLY
jgi:hypothetical protein